MAKTRSKDSVKAFGKLTRIVDGEPQIVGDPPLIVPIEDVAGDAVEVDEFLRGVIRSYRRTLPADRRRLLERFRYAHAARKVVGVGSVGTRAWIMLMLGRDESDPLFLQFKEAQTSVLEPFIGKSKFANHGQRVVEGQRLSQTASDIMLGWIRTADLAGVRARLLRAPAVGHEGLGDRRAHEPADDDDLRAAVRADARQGARTLGRSGRDRELSRLRRQLRPGHDAVRDRVRRPERARLRRACRRRSRAVAWSPRPACSGAGAGGRARRAPCFPA